jgi:hypothetical protein
VTAHLIILTDIGLRAVPMLRGTSPSSRRSRPALLNVVPSRIRPPIADNQARHIAVDLMSALEIACVRSIPTALQRHPHGSIVHRNLPSAPVVSGAMAGRASHVPPDDAGDCDLV